MKDEPDCRTASPDRTSRPNMYRVGYPEDHKVVATVMCGFLVAMSVIGAFIFISPQILSSDTSMTFVLGIFVLCLMMIYWAIEIDTTWCEINEQYIIGHGLPDCRFTIMWSDIQSVRTDVRTRYFGLERTYILNVHCMSYKPKFKVTSDMEIEKFSYLIMKHLPDYKWTEDRSMIVNYAREYEDANGIRAHKVRAENKEKPRTGAAQ